MTGASESGRGWGGHQVAHPRTFSRRSSLISLCLASFYLVWIIVCSHFNGVFPYPFLNKMPWPQVPPLLPPLSEV